MSKVEYYTFLWRNELVDIVDEDNQVIGQIMKTQAHLRGVLHRCVVAEVIDSKGNWLLVKQASDRQDAGQYISPVGGHIQASETEEDAFEARSDGRTRIKVTSFKRIGQAIFNRGVIGRKENHLFVFYEIYTDERTILNHESVGTEDFQINN